MLLFDDSFDSLVILYTYLIIYNFCLVSIFWTLFQFISTNFKTIHSFSDLKFDFHFVISLTIVLLSIAGVPPFLGFFSKVLLLVLLCNSHFFLFYIFFFGLVFYALYFYIQNIRFLYSSVAGKLTYAHISNLRLTSLFFNWNTLFLFFFIFGVFYADDILFFFYWLFL